MREECEKNARRTREERERVREIEARARAEARLVVPDGVVHERRGRAVELALHARERLGRARRAREALEPVAVLARVLAVDEVAEADGERERRARLREGW